MIVIGGSAGSLNPLRTLIGRLPADFPAAILVVIHVHSEFRSFLREIVSSSGPLEAKHPEEKEALKPGVVYVAPPDRHLLVEDGSVVLSRGPRENRHRPAIDPLFRSAARWYGPRVVGVVLSGELDDGAAGLVAIRMRGGVAVVQDPSEAASPEMPQRAIQYAGADEILRADKIGEFLAAVSRPLRVVAPTSAAVAVEDKTDVTQARLSGRPSAFACPDCHGVLWEADEGGLLRFTCRIGHSYSTHALVSAISQSTEDALWAAIRALEEKAALRRRMAPRAGPRLAVQYEEEAAGYERHAQVIRQILMESQAVEPAARPDAA